MVSPPLPVLAPVVELPRGYVRRDLLFVGSGVHGELSISNPRQVSFPAEGNLHPLLICSSEGHVCVLSLNDDIYCGGSNHCGQIGTGGELEDDYQENEDFEDLFAYIEPFTKVTIPERSLDDLICSIACGPRATAAVSESGILYFWGTLTPYQICTKPTIIQFPESKKVLQVALGLSHAIALVEHQNKHSVYVWGISKTGALGLPNEEIKEPTHVPFFDNFDMILSVHAGYSHSGVIVENRKLFVFGDCEYNPPNDDSLDPHIPRIVDFMEPGRCKVDVLWLGKQVSLMVIEGLVFGWGTGFCHILSYAHHEHELSSHSIHLLYSNKSDKCISVSCSENHISLVTEHGKGFSCGSSKHGALGMGNSHQDFAEPEEMEIEMPAKQVMCCKGCNFILVAPPIVKVSLENIMKFEAGEVPYIVEFLIEMLQKEGHRTTEGIFRTSGDSVVIDELLEMFNRDELTEKAYFQPTETYAGLLKHFLRQLNPPLIPTANLIEFCAIFEHEKTALGRYDLVYDELQKITPLHLVLLKRVLFLLNYISSFHSVNKMTAKNMVMCTLTGFFGHDIMGNMKRATTASAVLSMLIKDAPLWFTEKENLLPAQMNGLLDKTPYFHCVMETLFQAQHSFDPEKLYELFIVTGGFRKLCVVAMSGEVQTEYEWEQFRDILQSTLPLSSDVSMVFDAVQNISGLEPKLSLENVTAVSVLLELLARSATERPVTPITHIVQELITSG